MANAQVGIGTPLPADSSMLEVSAEDKGVLIPRVLLVNESDFAPIKGTSVESMLVYNIGTAMDKGFYYWSGSKWSKITTREELDTIIQSVVSGDVESFRELLNYLVPSNPGNKTPQEHSAMLYDEKEGLFFSMIYDSAANAYTRKDINMKAVVTDLETRTNILKSVVTKDGELPEFTVSNRKPVDAEVKAGDVFYQYLGENGEINYINMSSDVLNVIQNNENIMQEITNITKKGGNVYYTEVEVDGIPANSLYQINDKDEKVIIDIKSTVMNVIKQNLEEIRNDLSTNVVEGTVVNIGNKIDGKNVYSIKQKVTITGAVTTGVDLSKLIEGKTKVERIVSVSIYDNKKVLVSNSITDATISNNRLAFNIGQGKLYTILPSGDYDAIVEFTAE